jgi:hypothetical protein
MSLIYKILYQVGLTPWEGSAEQARTREQISAMFRPLRRRTPAALRVGARPRLRRRAVVD